MPGFFRKEFLCPDFCAIDYDNGKYRFNRYTAGWN